MMFKKDLDSNMMNAINYDGGANDLFQAIEAKQWDYAIDTCKERAELANQWHYRFQDESHGQKLRWKALPIHAALIHAAPSAVINAIIDAFPDGIEEADDQGLLPLHLAFRCKASDDVLKIVVQNYPDAIAMKDIKHRTPLALIPNSCPLRWVKYATFDEPTAEHEKLLARRCELEEKKDELLREKREFEKEIYRDKDMSGFLGTRSVAIENLKISDKLCVSTTMVGANDFLN